MVIMAILFVREMAGDHVDEWRDEVEVHEAIGPPCLVFPVTMLPHKRTNITVFLNEFLVLEQLQTFL